VETCFRDSKDLSTRFVYPDRTVEFAIKGETASTATSVAPPSVAGEAEKRFALGHNFHAIYLNLPQLTSADGTLSYGGSLQVRRDRGGRITAFTILSPDTTPVDVEFSNWRGPMPYLVTLRHAGITYRYEFGTVELRC